MESTASVDPHLNVGAVIFWKGGKSVGRYSSLLSAAKEGVALREAEEEASELEGAVLRSEKEAAAAVEDVVASALLAK